MPGEGRTERHPDRGDLVFGLHGADAEMLVLGQLVEDVAGRGDRVRTERDRQCCQLSGGDDAPGQSGVAGDARVLAGGEPGRTDLVTVADGLGGLAEVESGEERRPVRGLHLFVLGEPFGDPVEGLVGRSREHPRHQSEGEEVLRPFGIAWLHAEGDADLLREAGHRHAQHPIVGEAAVVERARLVADLRQVALVERVLVDDHRATRLEAVEVGHQGRGVHGDQDVRLVARCGDVVVGDVHLE